MVDFIRTPVFSDTGMICGFLSHSQHDQKTAAFHMAALVKSIATPPSNKAQRPIVVDYVTFHWSSHSWSTADGRSFCVDVLIADKFDKLIWVKGFTSFPEEFGQENTPARRRHAR
jgi:hypothetical protein